MTALLRNWLPWSLAWCTKPKPKSVHVSCLLTSLCSSLWPSGALQTPVWPGTAFLSSLVCCLVVYIPLSPPHIPAILDLDLIECSMVSQLCFLARAVPFAWNSFPFAWNSFLASLTCPSFFWSLLDAASFRKPSSISPSHLFRLHWNCWFTVWISLTACSPGRRAIPVTSGECGTPWRVVGVWKGPWTRVLVCFHSVQPRWNLFFPLWESSFPLPLPETGSMFCFWPHDWPVDPGEITHASGAFMKWRSGAAGLLNFCGLCRHCSMGMAPLGLQCAVLLQILLVDLSFHTSGPLPFSSNFFLGRAVPGKTTEG